LWSERYRPRELGEMVGNEDARKKLVSWIGKWKSGGKAALLVGPPGTGKTTTVHLIAEKLGLNLVELNASDTRTKEKLSRKIGEIISSENLFGCRTLIFLDEVDGLAGRSDYGAIDYIKEAVRKTENPVVMAANNPEADEVRKLSSVTIKIEFVKPSILDVVGQLRRIADSESLPATDKELTEVAEAANGDLRAAINSLQSGLPQAKDEELTSLQSIDGFFGAHSEKVALQFLRSYPGQPRDKVRDLFVSVSRAKILMERKAAALEVISRADVLMGRIFRGQDWRLLRYLDQMLATELWNSVGDGGARYASDAVPWPLQVRIWNDSRKLKDIASATGKRLGISQKGSLVGDSPYILLLCREEGFREGLAEDLALEENYVAFVAKESVRPYPSG